MKFKKLLIFIFLTLSLSAVSSFAQIKSIDVTSDFDFQQAINFANQQRVDTIQLATSGGVYTTKDTLYYYNKNKLIIKAKKGLAAMPIITHSDDSADVLEIFRVKNDLTIEGVIIDGGHERSHGMKYALRAGDGDGDPVAFKNGTNITLRNCIIRNVYEDKDINLAGHGLYFLKGAVAGVVKIENCTFENMGDEAIRMSETEKFETTKLVDSLIVRNCTFTNIDAECIRFYGDLDTSNVDGKVIVENLTINNSATRVLYFKNNKNTEIKNIIISNGRLPGADRMDRASYLIESQLPGTFITNVDTFNIVYGPVRDAVVLRTTKKARTLDPNTIFNFDPLYADAANKNFTLAANSPAFYSGVGNKHLGDLRWATNTPTVLPLNVKIEGSGQVTFDPERKGLIFPSGTAVTVTAVPDPTYEFTGWGGDLSGTANPAQITVDGIKNITAVFTLSTTDVENNLNPVEYSLNQNYPNPFNPSTAITFSLKKSGFATLKVYDVIGREINTLFSKEINAGTYTYFLDASKMSSGVYYYQLTSGSFVATKKMMLLK
ncbi:MAG: T9SS type A sorting domain-containing protein [Bacteroidetes bacterium]|nr:T9SS type A sorting domain-containing protein [Bacteroidota bacterium]